MKHTKISKILLVLFAVVLCLGPVGLAEPLGTAFTYRGRLIDNNQPADGLYDLQFKLYDSDADGNKIGGNVNSSETQVNDGYFTVELDFNDVNAFNGNARWLDIGVRPGELEDPNVYTALSPRQEITPAPYALYAKNGGGAGDSLWQLNGTSIYYNGDVEIGTTSPAAKLNVVGQVKITGGLPAVGKVLTSDAAGLATWQSPTETDPTVAASVKDGVSWDEVSGIPAGFADGVDNVGLTAESDPTVPAAIKDGISWGEVSGIPAGFADGVDDVGAGDNLGNHTATQNVKLNGYWLSGDGGNEGVYVANTGNVGIGTTSPAAKLDVSGDINVSGDIRNAALANAVERLDVNQPIWNAKQGKAFAVVAASNAPASEKLSADYVCDGINDEVQINAALTAYRSVALTEGNFYIGASITGLKTGKTFRGAGLDSTKLLLAANCDMIVISELETVGEGIFINISDMLLNGRKSTYTSTSNDGIRITTTPKDVRIFNVFIESFGGFGIACVGGWGMVLNNCILEYDGLGGFYEDPNSYWIITGISTGAFATGDTVTQVTSGATGTVAGTIANLGTSMQLNLGSGTFITAGAPHIVKDSDANVYFTPSSVSNGQQGPRIISCKIQDCTDGNQIWLKGNVGGAIIEASEIQSSASGHYGICLDGGGGHIIVGNKFIGHHASALGHIALGISTPTSNNVIMGNRFVTTSDTVPAIRFISSSLSSSISGNVFYQAYTSPVVNPIVRAYSIERNNISDNTYCDKNYYDIGYQYQSLPWTTLAETTAPAWKAAYNNSDAGWTTGKECTLPAAKVGMERQFYVQANRYLRIGPDGSETLSISVGGAQQAPGKYIQSTTIGDFIFLKCVIAGQWECMAVKGTWEVEG